jgi:fatty acid desaturase
MPTRESDNAGMGTAAKQVAEHASALARLELELAGLELKRKAANLGLGIGFLVAAAVFGLFAVGFGLAAAAAGFATFLATWLAILIVFGILLFLTLLLGLIALTRMKKGTPPVPEQAIQEAKRTTAALKSDGP